MRSVTDAEMQKAVHQFCTISGLIAAGYRPAATDIDKYAANEFVQHVETNTEWVAGVIAKWGHDTLIEFDMMYCDSPPQATAFAELINECVARELTLGEKRFISQLWYKTAMDVNKLMKTNRFFSRVVDMSLDDSGYLNIFKIILYTLVKVKTVPADV